MSAYLNHGFSVELSTTPQPMRVSRICVASLPFVAAVMLLLSVSFPTMIPRVQAEPPASSETQATVNLAQGDNRQAVAPVRTTRATSPKHVSPV